MPQTISITDDSLKSGIMLSHLPVIKFSSSSIVYAILDTTSNSYVAFESRNLTDSNNIIEEIKQSALVKILLNNGTGKSGKALILIDNPVFTIVPDELFNPGDAKKYLSFTHSYQANEGISIDKTGKVDSHNVYWLPQEIYTFIDRYFLLHEFRHFATIFLNCCFLKNKHQEAVYVYASENILYAVVFKTGKPVLCNAYEYCTKEDFVYFVMNIFEKLQLNLQTTSLFISGENENAVEYKKAISGYIVNVEFFTRSQKYNYCKGISEFPQYINSVLFSAFLCV
ncbi:MAG: DUF3822 family protein [Bacteroidota bacterium]